MRDWTPNDAAPMAWFSADNTASWTSGTTATLRSIAGQDLRAGNSRPARLSITSTPTRAQNASYNNRFTIAMGSRNGPLDVIHYDTLLRGLSGLTVFGVGHVATTGHTGVLVQMAYGSTVHAQLQLTRRAEGGATITAQGRRLDIDTLRSASADRSSTINSLIPGVYSGLWNFATGALQVGLNGVYTTADSAMTTGATPTNLSVAPRVGNTADAQDGLTEFGELLVFWGVLSEADRQATEGYLAHFYGLQAQLGESHPYKTGRPYWIGQTLVAATLGTASGQAVKLGGGLVTVLVVDWPSGELIDRQEPDAEGHWTGTILLNRQFGLTYHAAGCAPITHGPYTVTS